MNTTTQAPLPQYFDAEDKGHEWHLFCKACGKGWALGKESTQPGNILHLLNHARRHEAAEKRAKKLERGI